MKRLAYLLLLLAPPAFAQEEPQPAPPPPAEQPAPKPDPRIDELDARLKAVEQELEDAKDDNSYLEEKLNSLLPLQNRFTGYLDFGAFATTGNGAGTRTDVGHFLFPEYSYVPETWVFYGDPLSTTVNSRGDVADTGESRAIVFDPINSNGEPTFLINALNFALFSGIGETGQINASIDFIPRARDISDPNGLFLGDYLDIKLAYGEWRPQVSEKFDLTLQAGKFDSVLGYEYRSIESPDRIGVTPSLICRYTCGRPIGLKARARFLDEALIANVAVTNGSHFSEGFDFSNETDTNAMKTLAGRLSYQVAHKVEFGVSGAWGAQDFQPEDDVYQWHIGGDVHAEVADLELTAELVHGRAKGQTSTAAGSTPCDIAACLRYTGGYVQVAYRLNNTFIPYARVDYRDALHRSGASFVYVSDLGRATLGVRAEIGTRVIVKAEATKNQELGGQTVIPNDVVTSSLVLKY